MDRIDRPAGLTARLDAALAGIRREMHQPVTRRSLVAIMLAINVSLLLVVAGIALWVLPTR